MTAPWGNQDGVPKKQGVKPTYVSEVMRSRFIFGYFATMMVVSKRR